MSLIIQSAKYIISENLLIESIKSLVICMILCLCMAKAKILDKKEESTKNKFVQDDPVLWRRSTLVCVKDTPTRKLIYTCLKLVKDEPLLSRRSTLMFVQDTPTSSRYNFESSKYSVEPEQQECGKMVSVVDITAHKKTDICKALKDSKVPFKPDNTPEVLQEYSKPKRELGLEKVRTEKQAKTERFKKELDSKSTLNIPTTDEESETIQSDEIIEKVTPSWTKKPSLITPITVEPYSDKSFVVRGDTFEHKIVFAKFDGKWNRNLTDKKTGSRFGAWVFSNSKRVIVDKFLLELDHISHRGR